jgi:formylglycine-generating enzyme required for sulfatase activity
VQPAPQEGTGKTPGGGSRHWVSGPVRIVVATDSDWYGLVLSDDVQLVEVLEPPSYLEGEKEGYEVGAYRPEDGYTHQDSRRVFADTSKYAVHCAIDKPTQDFSPVRCEFRLNLKPVPGRETIRLRFGKGWRGRSETWVYDAEGQEILHRVCAGWGEEFGDWAEPASTIPLAPDISEVEQSPPDGGVWHFPPDAPPPAVAPFDAEAAKRHQQAWAEYLGVAAEKENSIGMKFVLIPPGEFDMGSSGQEINELLKVGNPLCKRQVPTQAPRHRVRITKPFSLGRGEVTVGEFRRFVQAAQYKTDAERDEKSKQDWQHAHFKLTDDHPVANVSWFDAVAFCQWLTAETGQRHRLPTEAEWEYACRAGTTGRYGFDQGQSTIEDHAWLRENARNRTCPAGTKEANAWGLCDMHGNLWEWCLDWYAPDYYGRSALIDPTGPSSGSQRVVRGGSYCDPESLCRSATRVNIGPSLTQWNHGFRVVCEIPQAAGE